MLQPTSPVTFTAPLTAGRKARQAEAEEAAPQDVSKLTALPVLETPDAVTTLASGFGYAEFPQVSPDGKRLIFNVVGDYTTSQMLVMSTKGGKVRSLVTGEEVTPMTVKPFMERHKGHTDEQGTWSEDGKCVYFRTNREGTFGIARFTLKSGKDELLVHDPARNMKHPVETEDGWLVCYGGPPGDKYPTVDKFTDLFLVNTETGQISMLTKSDGSVSYKHPSVMNGMIIAHKEVGTPDKESADLVMIDPATGKETPLTETPDVIERHPFYNDNVGLICYHSDETGDKNVWIREPDSDRRVQLTFYGKAAQSPCWSPEGDQIYFVKKGTRQAEGEDFFVRQADIRVIDVKEALKELKDQARAQVKELERGGAPEELVAQARERLENYRYFLEKY